MLDELTTATALAAGGPADTPCRWLATRVAPGCAKTAAIKNKTGAGGQLAVRLAKNAKPAGMALLQTPMPILALCPHVDKKPAHEPLVDQMPAALAFVFEFTLNLLWLCFDFALTLL